jgi:signal transduction histidine kinase
VSVEEVLRIISLAVYGLLLAGAVRYWRLQRVWPAVWLVATFAILALMAFLAVVTPEAAALQDSSRLAARRLGLDAVVVALVAFPYLLHRFVRALRARVTFGSRIVDAVMVGLTIWTLVLPRFPATGDAQPGWYLPYRTAFVLWWLAVLLGVAVSLWRAGNGQPGVARRRVRSMASASLCLSIAVLVSTVGQDSSALAAKVGLAASAVLGWLSAAGFLVGFAPPAVLRRMWRAQDEVSLRRSSAAMAGANTAQEAATLIVEPISALLGGQSALILDVEGHVLASFGREWTQEDARIEEPDRIVIAGRRSRLVVERSRLTPLFGAEEELLLHSIGAYLDVCLERIAAFEASENARKAALRASEELQQLVYGISHDLKNPLHTVIGFLKLLEPERPRLSDQGQKFVGRIQASTANMARLIDDLLRLSRIGRTDATQATVPLRSLIEEIGNDTQNRYDGVHVLCEGDAILWMNPVRARQLFTNLIENAARHGGRRPLTIRVELGSRQGRLQEVVVHDDGIGIPVEYREKVFAIFERLEGFSTSGGTGVGLAMCRRITQDIGGSIEITDASVGTRFRLTLPVPADERPDVAKDREVRVQHA